MSDDRQQLPMFPSENDPARELMMTVIRLQAEGLRSIAAVNHELVELEKRLLDKRGNGTIGSLRGTTIGSLRGESKQHKRRRHQPQNRKWRTWSGFRDDMQQLEARIRRRDHLKPNDEVAKETMATEDGLTVKTITRTMVETYGLQPNQWPPSTWPEELPSEI